MEGDHDIVSSKSPAQASAAKPAASGTASYEAAGVVDEDTLESMRAAPIPQSITPAVLNQVDKLAAAAVMERV